MAFRGLLFAIIPSAVLLSAWSATVPLPDPESLPEDASSVGKRTSRAQQKPGVFREYPGWEYNNFPIPPDCDVPGEWVFARFMYRAVYGWRGGRGPNWTIDYPRSDRHLSAAVRRLTRIQTRSVEQPVAAEDGDDIYNWPWLYAVEVGHWDLTDLQAAKLRDFLDRGGFFMCDDFHGTLEWEVFEASMRKVFPDRPIVDLPDSDPIFHSVYDLDGRYQVPGEQFVYSHRTYEKDGYQPRWRGIYDGKGRLVVAICHNMDLGDSWEHADNPEYPEQYSALGFRIGVNYLVYAMTH
ncbi:MAG: DUF4159 domain-containing protein [Acidobacteriaceae bacterium]|nr:DUF4159 domain-containing protein [Acidobacteriaceae bacterium]MBV9442122.1 DUF4159 domain-containing protein [Acidobacteriaceae bacterium]